MPFDQVTEQKVDDLLDTIPAFNWTAEIDQVLDRDGKSIPNMIARGVYHSDSGALLGICGRHTQLIQHRDVVRPTLYALVEKGFEIHNRPFGKRDLYDLKGERGAFISADATQNGSVMRCEIITGDFVNPTGNSYWLPDGEDTMLRRYGSLNSHTAIYAAQSRADYQRLRCMNGMVATEFSAVIKSKHTKGFDFEAFREKIITSAEMMEDDTERFETYIKTPCNYDQAKEFFEKTIAFQGLDVHQNPKVSEKLVTQLLELFMREPVQSVWGLYNAMTSWATHGEMRGNADKITGRIGRDDRVARAMRTDHFQHLLAA